MKKILLIFFDAIFTAGIYDYWRGKNDWVINKVNKGNLDSDGDNKCELYMRFRLNYINMDQTPNLVLPVTQFNYSICID